MTKTKKSLPSNDRLRDKNCICKNELAPLLADPAPNVKTKPDYLPAILKQIKIIYPKNRKWLIKLCPICGREYPYLPRHNPGHCGRFGCVYELAEKAVEKRGK